jgi:tetratricopeptide (TPR) repeat protein
LADKFPSEPVLRDLATSHLLLGTLLAEAGKWDEARVEYEWARELLQKLATQFPDVPEYRHGLARVHLGLGRTFEGLGKSEQFRAETQQAAAMLRKLAELYPAVPDYQRDLATIHCNLGKVQTREGRHDLACIEFEQARDLLQNVAAQVRTVPGYQVDVATVHHDLGVALYYCQKMDLARVELEEAVKSQQHLVAEYPNEPRYQRDLARIHYALGKVLLNKGLPAESLDGFAKAIPTLTRTVAKDQGDVEARTALQDCYGSRAVAHVHLGKYAEAVADFDRVIELSPAPDHLLYRGGRALTCAKAGQIASAISEVAELLPLVANAPGSLKRDGVYLYTFACVYAIAAGKVVEKKQEYADRAMELLERAVQAGYRDAAQVARDDDLAALRGREDFKKLLADLQ